MPTTDQATAEPNKDIAEWGTWDADEYLNTYFSASALGTDSFEAWKFLARELKALEGTPKKILDFGAGPTLFGTIPCAQYATEIHVCDYLECNLEAIQRWVDQDQNMFDWGNCISEVLKIEGAEISEESVTAREKLLRSKITKLQKCDAGKSPAIEGAEKYSLIISTYCVDSATNSKETWQLYMKNLLALLDDSGVMLLTALRNCKDYKVGDASFPCADIDEHDMEEVLKMNGFTNQYTIEICEALDCEEEGFTGLMFVKIQKN
jgi:DNA-binding Xre family transcriptional regulator